MEKEATGRIRFIIIANYKTIKRGGGYGKRPI